MEIQTTKYGHFRQKQNNEKVVSNWKPVQDPNDYVHLANLLDKNWTKEHDHCLIVNGKSFPEFTSTLEKSFDNISVFKELKSCFTDRYDSDLICLLFSVEQSYLSLSRALPRLKDSGTLFLRTLRHDVQLYKSLLEMGEISQLVNPYWVAEEIYHHNQLLKRYEGEYYIHEVYDIGDFRDYLIKFRAKPKKSCIGMIVKNEERDLPKLLETLEFTAEGICLIDTGSTDKTVDVFNSKEIYSRTHSNAGKKMQKHFRIYTDASTQDEKGEWKLWDFSKARNEYVKEIEELGYDYVIWMDADDVVEDPQLLKLLPLFHQYDVHGIKMMTGPFSGWIHHRVWKTGLGIHYEGRCHEYPTIGNFKCMLHDEIVVRHDATPVSGTENSNDRNLRILQKAAEEAPTSRIHFYLANTYKDRGDFENAAHWYQKRIDDGYCYYDEYLFAWLYKGRSLRAAGKILEAEKTLVKGYKLCKWAEFSMELCYLYMQLERYQEAIEWAHIAVKDWNHVPPKTALWREDNKYTDQPYRMITWCYKHLNAPFMAKHYHNKTSKLVPEDLDWADFGKNIVNTHSLAPEERSHLTLVRPGALGDIIMCATAAQAYKSTHPSKKDTLMTFKVHKSLLHMVEPFLVSTGIDMVLPLEESWEFEGRVISLVGYPIHEGYPDKPMEKHLLSYLQRELGLNVYISVPNLYMKSYPRMMQGDYITVHPQALWSPYKNWDINNWNTVINHLPLPVYQIGGPEDSLLLCDDNFLGFAFNTALNLISHAKMHMGVDSWSNHATNIIWDKQKRTKGLILWGSTQMSAAGYEENKNITHKVSCQPCFKEDPKISKASKGPCENNHACMRGIKPMEVLHEIVKDLNIQPLEVDKNRFTTELIRNP